MKKYFLLFEEFTPEATDRTDEWDIPTSKNCAVKTINIIDEDGKTLLYSQDESEGLLFGDVYYTNNDNTGYTFDLHRQWIDETLGNQIMNYLAKNYSSYNFPLSEVVTIEVSLLPEGGKKPFTLLYVFDGKVYKLTQKRYLPLK
jgi:hypothetical protein